MKNKIELLRRNFDLKNALKLLDEIINLGDENFLNEFLYEFSDLLMKGDAIYLINSHVSYYLNKEDFQTALKVLNDYQNGPFINLTTEEFMEDLHQEILKLMSPKKNKYLSPKDIERDLLSSNEDKILHVINFLNDQNIRSYLDLIGTCLKSDKLLYKYKILILFILVEQQITLPIGVKDDEGNVFTFIPSQNKLPFLEENYLECVDYLHFSNESPSVIKMAIEILNIVQVRMYPKSLIEDSKLIPSYGEILIFLAKEYLMEDVNLQKLIETIEFLEEDTVNLLNKIREILL